MTLGFSAKQNVHHFGISENVCCLRVRTCVCETCICKDMCCGLTLEGSAVQLLSEHM